MLAGPRILVVGAGLGGLTLAQALHRSNLEVEVFESDASASTRGQGYRLTIDPQQGGRALRDCLPPRLHDLAAATRGRQGDRFTIYDEKGKLLQENRFPRALDAGDAEISGQVDRFTLRQILLGGLAERVHFQKALSSYEQTEEGVVAHFADGTSATGDILVGADGINSEVRRQLLPEAAVVDTGVRAIFGRSPLMRDDGPVLKAEMVGSGIIAVAPDGRTLFFTSMVFRERPEVAAARLAPDIPLAAREDYVMWAVVIPRARDSSAATPDAEPVQEIAERTVEGFDPAFARIVTGADAADTMYTRIHTSTPAPAWLPGRVTLLGDAVHCMPPFGAHGANTALRDAGGLARHLISAGSGREQLLSAIGAYEAEMREYAFEAVRQADAGMRQVIGPAGSG